MLTSVAFKTLRDQRRALLFWAMGLVGLVGMYAGIYPSMRGNTAYKDILDQMPEQVRALFTAGAGGDVTSGPGYLYVELLSFMAPMLVLIYAIGAGAAAIAGEEDRHTLDLLLACPVSRRRVVLEKFAAMSAGLALLTVTLAVTTIALGAAAEMKLSTANVAAAMLHLALLGAVFGALALLLGSLTGRVALSRAVPALVAVAAYLVNGFATTVDWLRPVRPASPFYQYIAHDPIRSGVSWLAVTVALATIAVLVAGAVWGFQRRDVQG
jgi:ABC-2 type transport system permease protein